MADLTLRSVKGSPLTNAELDGNFEYFTGSHAVTGSLTLTGNLNLNGNISSSTFQTTITGTKTTGSILISGSQTITGSINISHLLTLGSSNPLPSVVNGSISFSSSGDFYFGSGSAWHKLTL